MNDLIPRASAATLGTPIYADEFSRRDYRRFLAHFVFECGGLKDFKRNPQAFIEICGRSAGRSAWHWSTGSNTKKSATSTITLKNFSSRKS
jgi:hypothetical protein